MKIWILWRRKSYHLPSRVRKYKSEWQLWNFCQWNGSRVVFKIYNAVSIGYGIIYQ